jgi:hypothetical protein
MSNTPIPGQSVEHPIVIPSDAGWNYVSEEYRIVHEIAFQEEAMAKFIRQSVKVNAEEKIAIDCLEFRFIKIETDEVETRKFYFDVSQCFHFFDDEEE